MHRQIVERLRGDGHELTWVAENAPTAPDDVVLRTARERAAVLLTADKDFGELKELLGAFTVVSPGSIRIRRLDS